jgi:multidrug efflux pump subunit AcrB
VRQGVGTDVRTINGDSFVVIRLSTRTDAGASVRPVRRIWEELPQRADIHPDVWDPIVITPGVSLVDLLAREAGPKYSYRELDDFTDRIEKAIKIAPEASRVTTVGVIEEQIEARYSQNRLAAFGIIPAAIRGILQGRNTTLPTGTMNA